MIVLRRWSKTHKLFKSFNFEGMSITLICISCMSHNKVVERPFKVSLTHIICKIETFKVVNEYYRTSFPNACKVSTLINRKLNIEPLSCSMSDNLSSVCFSFWIPISLIMIALNPESKIACSFLHLTIRGCIIIIIFHVLQVLPHFSATKSNKNVNDIRSYDDAYCRTYWQESIDPYYPYHQSYVK